MDPGNSSSSSSDFGSPLPSLPTGKHKEKDKSYQFFFQ
jgi:hypothetical protein